MFVAFLAGSSVVITTPPGLTNLRFLFTFIALNNPIERCAVI